MLHRVVWHFISQNAIFFNTPPQRARFLTGLQQESELSKRVSKKITLMAQMSHSGLGSAIVIDDFVVSSAIPG